MVAEIALWLFWAALVASFCLAIAPVVALALWASDRDSSIMLASLLAVTVLVWAPATAYTLQVILGPWAHSLGLQF